MASSQPETFLSESEYARYARHLRLNGFGEASQIKLKTAKVLIIGAGGLGSPILLYLAAAGVGTIGIVDYDSVDISNLQRQILFQTEDTGKAKAAIAADKIKSLNPFVNVVVHKEKIDSTNAMKMLSDYDVIADGSDNFPTRYLVNDAAVLSGKPLVYGSVFRFEGQVSVFNYPDQHGNRGPNYRDLFPLSPSPGSVPDCSEAGVLGVLPGIIGSMQALEVLKIIAGIGNVLSGKIFHFEALGMTSQTFMLSRRKDNPLNGEHPSITALIDYEAFCSGPDPVNEINVQDFAKLKSEGRLQTMQQSLAAGGHEAGVGLYTRELIDVSVQTGKADPPENYKLIDVRRVEEYNEVNIGGTLFPLESIIDGSADIEVLSGKNSKFVFHCKSGSRSLKAIRLLMQKHGFKKEDMFNLKGGIDAYLSYEKTLHVDR